MTWYFGGAALITVLFLLNAMFVHRLRSRRSTPREPTRESLGRPQSGLQIAAALMVCAVLVTCLGASIVAPGSAFGQMMANPWAVVCTLPYMMAIGAAGAVLVGLRRRRAAGSRRAGAGAAPRGFRA